MNNRLYISAILLALLLGHACCAIAQVEESSYNESVIVTGSFTPVIESKDKINVAPAAVDTSTVLQHKFSYSLQPYRLTSLYTPARIKAVRITGEPRTRLYHTYFRLGMGNYWSPLAEANYMSTTSRNLNFGAHVNHQSSWGKIGDKDNPQDYYGSAPYSLTDVSLFGKYIVKERLQLYTDLSYQNDYNLYYGFNDSILGIVYPGRSRDSLESSDYKAAYNYIGWRFGLKSLPSASRWSYALNGRLADLMGTYGQTEFNYNFNGLLGYDLSLGNNTLTAAIAASIDGYNNNIELYTEQPLGHILEFDPTWQPDSNYMASASRLLAAVNPYLATTLAGFAIHAGANIAIDGYTTAGETEYYVFPDVSISRSFLRESLGISLSATGSAEAMSWNKQRLQNPYIMPGSNVATFRSSAYSATVRYNFSKKLELDIFGTYYQWRDWLTFRLDDNYSLGNVYNAIYQSFDFVDVGGEFSFVNDEILTFRVGGSYDIVTNALDSVPILYSPDYNVHLGLDINYHDRFLFHLQGQLLSPVCANYDYNSETLQYEVTEILPMRYGLNLEFEYRHNRALSFFLKADNLLFQRYYYWQNYPSQRGRFTLGLTYTIPTI